MSGLISILIVFTLSGEKYFDQQIKNYLDQKFFSFAKYEYQIVNEMKGFSKIEISDDKNFRLNKNFAYIPVKVYDENNFASSSLLTVRVKLYKKVLMACQKIERNSNLNNAMFTSQLADVTMLNGSPVTEEKLLNDFRTKILVKEGSILFEEMIEPVPLIYKGDKIVIHAGKNGVDISLNGIARQDGCLGDVISVQSDRKFFKAKIIDKFNLTLVE